MRTYASTLVKKKSFYRKSGLQMFLLISGGYIGGQFMSNNMAPSSGRFPIYFFCAVFTAWRWKRRIRQLFGRARSRKSSETSKYRLFDRMCVSFGVAIIACVNRFDILCPWLCKFVNLFCGSCCGIDIYFAGPARSSKLKSFFLLNRQGLVSRIGSIHRSHMFIFHLFFC